MICKLFCRNIGMRRSKFLNLLALLFANDTGAVMKITVHLQANCVLAKSVYFYT